MNINRQKTARLNRIAALIATAATITTANAASRLIEEVVITAQKREQNLQDVSISVAAFGGEQLEQLGVNQVQDILQFIPNVEVTSGGVNDLIAIRGVKLDDFADGNESPVGFYIDEVYKATLAGQMTQLYDLERVEVLRGPQGTLFGRNTTGGLFHAVTRKPTEEFEFKSSLQGGSFGQTILETAISGPLSDGIRGRLSYIYNRDEGYQEDEITDRNYAATDVWSVRGQLDFDISDNVSLLLSASNTEQRNTTDVYGISGTVDVNTGDRCSDAEINAGASNCQVFGFGFQNPDPDDKDSIFTELDDLNNDLDLVDLSAKLTWQLHENLTLTSITAYGTSERFYQEDNGPTLLTFGEPGAVLVNYRVEAEQWTQELRLNGSSDQLNWVAGIYYFNDKKEDGSIEIPFFVDAFGPLGSESSFELDSESWAVFGQVDISLTDALTLILGVRYTEDEKELDLTVGTPSVLSANPDIDTEKVTWRAGLDFNISDDLLLYANVSTGFKSGAFNTSLVTSAAETDPVGEEEVTSYELGWKATLLDGRAKFNGAFFYSDYSDLQASAVTPTGTGTFSSLFSNFGDAEIYGAELDLTLALTDQLEMLFTFGWLETELDAPDVFNPFGFSIDGGEIKKTPQFTFSGIGIYAFDLGDSGSLKAQAAATWSDEYNLNETRPNVLIQDDFWLFDARLTWSSPDEKMSVALFGENLGDEDYFFDGFDVAGSVRAKFWGKPRTWGLKVSYNY